MKDNLQYGGRHFGKFFIDPLNVRLFLRVLNCAIKYFYSLFFSFLLLLAISGQNVTFHLSTSVFGFAMDIPVENNDACGQELMKCPVIANEPTTFTYKSVLDETIPLVSYEKNNYRYYYCKHC